MANGHWTSTEIRDTADFAADMTMSDFGTTAPGAIDPTQAGQTPHTHQID